MKQVWCRAGSRFPLMDKLHAVEKHKWRRLWGHACVLCCRKWITLSRRKYTRNLLSLPFERAFKMPAGSRGWFKQTGMTESKVSSLLYNEVVQSFYKRKGSLELNHLKLTNSKTVCEVLSRESNWLIDLLSNWLWFNRREGSSEDFLKIMAAIHKGKGPILTHGLARGYPNFTLTWMDNKCWVPGSWLCLPRWRVRAAGAVGLPASLQGARQQGLVGSARSGCATTARRPARGAAGWGFNRLGVKSEWRETVERQIMCITNLNILLIDFFFFFLSAALTSADLTLEELTEDGDTALTLAVEAGLVANVKMLLLHGASPHSTNSRNESPLLIGRHTRTRTQSLIPY